MPPSAVQLLKGNETLVEARAPNTAPTLFVKLNWNLFVSIFASVIVGGVGTGTLMLTMLLVLGMPLTNTVAMAQPGGKIHTGSDVNEFVDQFVVSKNVVCPLSTLLNCTSG
jgi:hypothetical protein